MTVWLEVTITLLMARLRPYGQRVLGSRLGQSMVEYSIIAALVAIVALGAVSILGRDLAGIFTRIAGSVAGLGGG